MEIGAGDLDLDPRLMPQEDAAVMQALAHAAASAGLPSQASFLKSFPGGHSEPIMTYDLPRPRGDDTG